MVTKGTRQRAVPKYSPTRSRHTHAQPDSDLPEHSCQSVSVSDNPGQRKTGKYSKVRQLDSTMLRRTWRREKSADHWIRPEQIPPEKQSRARKRLNGLSFSPDATDK